MGNILNKKGLEDFFDADLDLGDSTFFDELDTEDNTEESTEVSTTEEDEKTMFMKNIASLMKDVQGLIAAAKYLCDSSPEAETIMAASSMFTSASQLLKELNKSAMQIQRFEFLEKHEKMKIEARMDLARFKAEQNKKLILSNSTVNIQNNNINNGQAIPFSQESIVEEILKQEQLENKKDNDDVIDAN